MGCSECGVSSGVGQAGRQGRKAACAVAGLHVNASVAVSKGSTPAGRLLCFAPRSAQTPLWKLHSYPRRSTGCPLAFCRYIARTLGGGDDVFHVAEDYSDLVWHDTHLDYNPDPVG